MVSPPAHFVCCSISKQHTRTLRVDHRVFGRVRRPDMADLHLLAANPEQLRLAAEPSAASPGTNQTPLATCRAAKGSAAANAAASDRPIHAATLCNGRWLKFMQGMFRAALCAEKSPRSITA